MSDRIADVHERNIQRWLHRHDCRQITPAAQTGRLVAVPYSGIGYRTATQQGITTGNGEFRYRAGERVTFFIGDADFPGASAGSTVTPYDMGTTHNEPINVVRFLCLLCAESDGTLPIPSGAARWTRGSIDFAVEPALFARQPVVARIISHSGRQLLDEHAAVERIDTLIARYIYRS